MRGEVHDNDTGSQQIADLMRNTRPEAFAGETEKLERNVP